MASLPNPPDGLPPEDFFRGHLKLIEQVIAHACQRFRLRREDAEDFSSWVKVKLIENDYRKIREFKGSSTPRTYLTIVIVNLVRDYINHLWGKWRSSEEAKRLGDVAVKLEELIVRDGYSFEMAVQLLRQNFNVEASRRDLEALAARLPPRMPRRMEGEEVLQGVPARDLNPEEILLAQERGENRRRFQAKLFRALKILSGEDRLLVLDRTRLSVAEIARSRGIEQKPLYRRLDKIYKTLREALEREGVRRSDIDDILRADDPLDPEEG
jgi:RNA polymerase sigma factor (sigma-70 family)